jgi:hypothetical protein
MRSIEWLLVIRVLMNHQTFQRIDEEYPRERQRCKAHPALVLDTNKHTHILPMIERTKGISYVIYKRINSYIIGVRARSISLHDQAQR